MKKRIDNDVVLAFEVLLEEIESAVESLNKMGAEAFEKGDYEGAKELTYKGSQMTLFREKVQNLQKEWKNLFAPGVKAKRGEKERLRKGMRTPEDFFREPILQALNELGGSAPMADVLDKVYKAVKSKLNWYDMQPLSSDPQSKRWRNTAQWCRSSLVKEGLLKSDSPRGIWELSEEGKKYLEKKAGSKKRDYEEDAAS
ncbi:MAG: winged helix-turn-helix domain-containing protein [Actinomycetota bacterium]